MRLLTTVDCGLDLKLAVGVGAVVPDASNLPLTLQYAVSDALLFTLVPGQHATHACTNDGYPSVFHGPICLMAVNVLASCLSFVKSSKESFLRNGA